MKTTNVFKSQKGKKIFLNIMILWLINVLFPMKG